MTFPNLPGDWAETRRAKDLVTCEAQLAPEELEQVRAAVGHVRVEFEERAYRKERDGRRGGWEHVTIERTLLAVHERSNGWVDATFGAPPA